MSIDMFMKIEGERQGNILGESRDKKHAEEIDVIGWKWGMIASRDSGPGLRSGAANVQHFVFKKYIDKSSPLLITALVTNEGLPTAVLTCRKMGNAGGDPVEFLIITFEQAAVVAINRQELAEDDRLTEEITLSFRKFTEDYTEQKVDGKIGNKASAAHDVANNK